MDKLKRTEAFCWIAIYFWLSAIVGLIYIQLKDGLGEMVQISINVVLPLLIIALCCVVDKVNDIHREQQLERYRLVLEPHRTDRQYLMSELARIEDRLLVSKLIGRSYNMGKQQLVKDMIKELENRTVG